MRFVLDPGSLCPPQVVLINAVKDVAKALGDLISATKAAAGKSGDDPAVYQLKNSAKVGPPQNRLPGGGGQWLEGSPEGRKQGMGWRGGASGCPPKAVSGLGLGLPFCPFPRGEMLSGWFLGRLWSPTSLPC